MAQVEAQPEEEGQGALLALPVAALRGLSASAISSRVGAAGPACHWQLLGLGAIGSATSSWLKPEPYPDSVTQAHLQAQAAPSQATTSPTVVVILVVLGSTTPGRRDRTSTDSESPAEARGPGLPVRRRGRRPCLSPARSGQGLPVAAFKLCHWQVPVCQFVWQTQAQASSSLATQAPTST